MTASSELRDLAATMREMVVDPELCESLAIVTEMAEAIAEDEATESAREARQEYAGNRCPERE